MRYRWQVEQAADASDELARRMEQGGNFYKLHRAREQVFFADASLNLARAEQARRATRKRLTRLLGAWGAQIQFMLPNRLPNLAQAARNLFLTKTTRFVNVLELGVMRNSSNEAPTRRGWEIGFAARFTTSPATNATR